MERSCIDVKIGDMRPRSDDRLVVGSYKVGSGRAPFHGSGSSLKHWRCDVGLPGCGAI